jgi:hypothetical protein
MTRLRIRNDTGSDLTAVRVYPPAPGSAPVDFGPVAAGATTGPREVPGLYRFAHLEVEGPAGTFTLQPYDYVGEEPLPPGDHTFGIGLAGDRLTLAVERTDAPES